MLLFLSPAYKEVSSLQSLDTSAFYGDVRTVLPPPDCSGDQLDSVCSAPSDYSGDQLDSALLCARCWLSTPSVWTQGAYSRVVSMVTRDPGGVTYVTLSRADVELRANI